MSIMLDTNLLNLDDTLNQSVGAIDILDAVTPLNFNEQRELFFEKQFSIEPDFKYQDYTLNAFEIKRSLYKLPIEDIQDEDLRELYHGVIDSYVDKVDQYKAIGTREFLYDSLRYYGEPNRKDLGNAKFILHLPDDSDKESNVRYSADTIASLMQDFAAKEGYEYTTSIDNNMIANALVSGTTLKINAKADLSEKDAWALAHHELGVHLATTLNGRTQPLKVLSLGCPVNTMTQEGLAILSEYLSGHLSIKRLKNLALRVIAVKSLIVDYSFRRTFLLLKEQYAVPEAQAFTITARVYRAGGFTKDYLYLQGFHQVLNAYEKGDDFLNLLAGKTSLEYLPHITRLIDKGLFKKPMFITPAFRKPIVNDVIQQFVTHAIK